MERCTECGNEYDRASEEQSCPHCGRRETPSRAHQPEREPTESWRGSGLAEDVHSPSRSTGNDDPDAARKIENAERELGLPHRS